MARHDFVLGMDVNALEDVDAKEVDPCRKRSCFSHELPHMEQLYGNNSVVESIVKEKSAGPPLHPTDNPSGTWRMHPEMSSPSEIQVRVQVDSVNDDFTDVATYPRHVRGGEQIGEPSYLPVSPLGARER